MIKRTKEIIQKNPAHEQKKTREEKGEMGEKDLQREIRLHGTFVRL